MKQFANRSISLVTVAMLLIVMCFTNASAKTTATGYTKASDVQYQYYNASDTSSSYYVKNGVKNWGARGEDCVFLTTYAQNYYTGNNTFDKLSKTKGGTSQTNAPSSALYASLKSIMTVNFNYVYNKRRDIHKYIDCVSNDTSKLVSFYSGTLVNSTWDGGNTYNTEHCWPDSKCLSSGRSSGDSADLVMLRPTIPNENGSRGNKAYGESSGYYEPTDEVKGDCARIVLYGYVRWGNTSKMWGSSGVMENLTILLKWMEEDPVDTWEMGRNDAVQSITGNRNVFIDYPEYAWLLFGKTVPNDMTTPSGKAKSGVSGGTVGGGSDSGNAGNTNSSTNSGTNNNNNSNNNNNNSNNNSQNNNTNNVVSNGTNSNNDSNNANSSTISKPQNPGKPFNPNNLAPTYNDGDTSNDYIIWFIIGGAVVILGAAAVITVVIIKKRKK